MIGQPITACNEKGLNSGWNFKRQTTELKTNGFLVACRSVRQRDVSIRGSLQRRRLHVQSLRLYLSAGLRRHPLRNTRITSVHFQVFHDAFFICNRSTIQTFVYNFQRTLKSMGSQFHRQRKSHIVQLIRGR